ncbi:restriction endonuclease subunit S [Arenicella xantha]|nr:restriction endonuclease subunit S [Arenicella xantha]
MDCWPVHNLVDVTDLITCGVAKRPNYVDSGIPFLSAKNVKNGMIIWNGYQYITKQDHDELTKNNKPTRGDILYTRVGSFGEAAIVDSDEEFSVFVSLTLIKPKHDILYNRFLKYYLNSSEVKQLAKSSISGSGVGNLNVGTVRKFPIPLPPIPEQQRIVAILDQAFADIDKARANAEQNLKNARELFDSYLQQVFSQRGEGWVETPLAECLELITYGFTNPMPAVEDGPWMVTAKNVIDGQVDYTTARHTSRDAFENLLTDKSRPRLGDVLLTKDGTLGRLAVVEQTDICVNQSVAVLRPNEKVGSHFLRLLLSSPDYQKKMIGNAGGATIKHIYITRVDKMLVTYPTCHAEQQRIVERVLAFVRQSQRITSIYKEKLTALEELKKSLLQKAFSGELTKSKDIAA